MTGTLYIAGTMTPEVNSSVAVSNFSVTITFEVGSVNTVAYGVVANGMHLAGPLDFDGLQSWIYISSSAPTLTGPDQFAALPDNSDGRMKMVDPSSGSVRLINLDPRTEINIDNYLSDAPTIGLPIGVMPWGIRSTLLMDTPVESGRVSFWHYNASASADTTLTFFNAVAGSVRVHLDDENL